MKLFTKDINQKLFAQYRIGSNLNKQKVVAKIFNPYGEGRWYLLNSDPNDPDYLWAIVQMGNEVEIGSVSRRELESIRIKPFGLPLERDIYFNERIAMEVLDGLEKGQTFAAGGMIPGRWYKDNSGKEFRYIGESQGKLLFNDGEKIVYKDEEDFDDAPKEKKLFGFFEEGGETEEGVDLFEDYDEIPDNVQEILQKYDFEEGDYRTLEKAKKDVETVGYTFEYSLDGTAYDLRKIGQKGKSEDEEDYAKGGMVTLYDDYDKSAGYIVEKGNKYWTGKNWSDIKAYAESYKTKKEAEQKLKSTKMAKGGEINWGQDLGDGFSIGNDVKITDTNSRFWNKYGYLVGKIGQRLVVRVGNDEMDAVVAKEYVKKLDAPMADGGEVDEEDSLDYNSISDLQAERNRLVRWKYQYNNKGADYQIKKLEERIEYLKSKDSKMADGGTTKRTVKLTLSDKDSYDYTYKQDGATASITFGFGKEPFQYEVKKISKSLEPLKQDILDAFTIQGIKQHEYKGGFTEAIKHLDTKVVYEDKMAKGGETESYEVVLSAVPNVDYEEDRYEGSIEIKPKKKKVKSIEEAQSEVRKFIVDNELGGGNFNGGDVYKNGEKIGYVSYNGRFWDKTNMAKGGKVGDPLSEEELKKLVERLSKKDKLDMQESYALSKAKYNLERINKSKMAKGGEVKIDKEWQKKELLELNNWHKEKIKETKSRLKEFGFNENHRDYRETFEKLDKVKDTSKKLIQSGILENGRFDIKYQFIFKSAGYPESYVALDKQIILSKPKYQEELDAYKKQYPYTYSRDRFVAEKIGDITKPILGFPLATSSAYSEGNSKIGKSFADGGKLVGKQKNLDVNKNGKLDAEDFKMLRGEKMADGGKINIGTIKKTDTDVLFDKQSGTFYVNLIDGAGNRVNKVNVNTIDDVFEKYPTFKLNTIGQKEFPDSMAMGGKVKFEDKVKAIKESLLKRKKVSPKVQKDYGKTYSPKEAEESAKRIAASQRLKYELKKKFKKGGKTIAQTPAPKKDRVFGSSKNKPGSASSKKSASKIELNESIVKTLTEKAKEYNEKHSSKVSTSTLKAVMRRGMGAYSTSHRPTITGGAPNSRQAWGFARVNKFLKKKGGAQVKAAYVQDDDLL